MTKLLLVLILSLLTWNPLFAGSRLQLRNIAFKEGLNNMNISSIAQDQLGYIWVSTMGGVSRYNGYEFKRFYFDSGNPSSLRSNHVASLFCSSEGLIYIGTVNGLNCFDNKTGMLSAIFPDFKNNVLAFAEQDGYIYIATASGLCRFRHGDEKLEPLGNNLTLKPSVSSLLIDRNGDLVCGLNNGNGLAVYDKKTDRLEEYRKTSGASLFDYNSVRTLYQSGENTIMVGSRGGIGFFDTKKRQFTEPQDFSTLISGVSGYDIRFILEKEPSIYWIGTLQGGLFIYDKARNSLVLHFQNDGYSEIHSNNYMCCLTDRSGNVWLGTFDAGLDVSFKQAKNFNFDIYLNKLTQGKFITSITKDLKNNLVVTTRENGLIIYDAENKSHQLLSKMNSGLGHSNLRTVFVDSENKYWIGIYFGLQIYDPQKRTFQTLALPQPNNGAVSILQADDRIYAGTDGQGLLVFDLKGNLLSQHITPGINIPRVIRLNRDELLLVSYNSGLFTMNIHDHAINKIEMADVVKYPGLLFAMNALKDKKGKVWIGTYNYGLYAFDFEHSKIVNYNIKEGLPSSDVIGIEEDDSNNLWLSTSFGLARLNKETNTIKTYFFNEGVNNYQFHGKAAYKDASGIIYFGGNSGLTYFNPAEIVLDHSDAPRVVLENLYVQNIPVVPNDQRQILKEGLSNTKKIILTHKDQPFSLDFVSFDYLSPEKLQYSYILEGFDKEWNNVGTQRRVSYSNLPRGNYIFKVKSVNGAGVKSENEAELMIRIKPAPLLSYLAWAFYLAIIAGIAFFIFRLRIKTLVYKHNLENEHSEHQREREINGMKQKFFTNISHELRTPLTLIYGLVSQLSRQENLTPQLKEYSQSLDLNVNRLLKLINQLLTFKTIECETLTLWLEYGNINEEIRKILELFSLYAKEKDIRIVFFEDDGFSLHFDHDKLEKILSNLLSNAIKHTEKGGRIEVGIR
ncbi:MAG TPA: two-component regulator propeller domain-containing protein, partial [Prolixibacteraceae bacterium]|nr:two-component regulator propeller domain-containing protein [Prolixibacteraceae bacterium]